jgi:outer membrane protein TolC
MSAVSAAVATGVPADLLRRRPDVRAAERQVAAQVPQIGVAEAELYPSVSIGTLLGHTDFNLGPALTSNGFLAFFTPQVSWKILNYGRLVNNVHSQEARTRELIGTYQSTVLRAAQEVQTSLRAFLETQEQADELSRSAAAAVAATAIEEELFRTVKADVNRLFTLENSKLQEQDNLAVAQGNIALSLINVYRALGGGWEVRKRPGGFCPQPAGAPVRELPPGPEKPTLPAPREVPKPAAEDGKHVIILSHPSE